MNKIKKYDDEYNDDDLIVQMRTKESNDIVDEIGKNNERQEKQNDNDDVEIITQNDNDDVEIITKNDDDNNKNKDEDNDDDNINSNKSEKRNHEKLGDNDSSIHENSNSSMAVIKKNNHKNKNSTPDSENISNTLRTSRKTRNFKKPENLKVRTLVAEDYELYPQVPAPLLRLCLIHFIKQFEIHIANVDKLGRKFKKQVLARLPLSLPLEVEVHVEDDEETFGRDDGSSRGKWGYDDENSRADDKKPEDYFKNVQPSLKLEIHDLKNTHWSFWKKRCKNDFPLEDVSKHGGSWKRTYLEAYMARMIESIEPAVKSCAVVESHNEGNIDKNGANISKNTVGNKVNTNISNKDTEKIVKTKCKNIYKLRKYKPLKEPIEETSENKPINFIGTIKKDKETFCCCQERLLHVAKILSPYVESLHVTQLKIEGKAKSSIDVTSNNQLTPNYLNTNSKKAIPASKDSNSSAASVTSNNNLNKKIPKSSKTQLTDNLMLAKESCMKLMGEEEDEDEEKNHLNLSLVLPLFPHLTDISLQFSVKEGGTESCRKDFKASVQDCKNLAKALSECKKLKSFSLINSQLTDSKLSLLLSSLSHLPSLNLLDLSYNKLSNKALEKIVVLLFSSPLSSLQSLVLAWNEVSDKGAYFLARCLKRGGPDAEDEDEIEEKEEDSDDEKSKKKENRGAEKSLDLSQKSTKIVMKTKEEHLKKSIKVPLHSIKCPLKHLNLRMNSLTDEGSASILASLRHNEMMTSLNLSGCHVADASVTALCSLLQYNSKLSYLDLSCNPISNKNGEEICKALESGNKNIVEMDVREGGLSVEWELLIGEACRKNMELLMFQKK